MLTVQMDKSGRMVAGPDGTITPSHFVKGVIMRLGLYGFVNKGFSPENPNAKMLKSIYRFGGPLEVSLRIVTVSMPTCCCLQGFTSPDDREQDAVYKEWVLELVKEVKKHHIDGVKVLVGGHMPTQPHSYIDL